MGGLGDLGNRVAELLLSVPAVLWAITFHEYCHGWVADRLGDPTARLSGRLSLNPIHHFDLIGALMLLFFRFGWAKPVPIDPRYFRHPKRDLALVSAAGAAGNLLTVLAVGLVVRLTPGLFVSNYGYQQFMVLLAAINAGLAVFNLIPIPPLDGSKLLGLVLPPSALPAYFRLEPYGMFLLMGLVLLNVIPWILSPIVGGILSLVFF
jgi:Zn-dependent protease